MSTLAVAAAATGMELFKAVALTNPAIIYCT